MMFQKIFIENDLVNHPQAKKITKKIIQSFPKSEKIYLKNMNEVFGRVKKPYLHKKTHLNLFLGSKKGQIVKLAPDAYGISNSNQSNDEPHYYFVHSYNCIYECEYCYLQGYFHSPDIVLFLNHEEICEEIQKTIDAHASQKKIWFHAGEFSDSLALSHLSGELESLFEVFYKNPQAFLELRTKSVNLRAVLNLLPAKNIIISFSLSPAARIEKTEHKTPRLHQRLQAMKSLISSGHRVAVHFDPIIYEENFLHSYSELILEMNSIIPIDCIEYISLGVVRFTKEVYAQVQKNYPDSDLHLQEWVKSFDNKVRYAKPIRLWMMKQIQQILIEQKMDPTKVYLCMEKTQLLGG